MILRLPVRGCKAGRKAQSFLTTFLIIITINITYVGYMLLICSIKWTGWIGLLQHDQGRQSVGVVNYRDNGTIEL